jgi:hypothetical protein
VAVALTRVQLSQFLLGKLNGPVEELRAGVDRIGELYDLPVRMDEEPECTRLERLQRKAERSFKHLQTIEAHLTSQPVEAIRARKALSEAKEISRADATEQVINGFLARMDEVGAGFEDCLHSINERCLLRIRLEPRFEEPYLDMKQFIAAVIRKYQRIAFGWNMIQIMVVTNNIDVERAPAELLEDAQKLKFCYDQDLLSAEEYALRRLQILDKMFRRQRAIEREDQLRWDREQVNLKEVYGERKVALPTWYDPPSAHKELDYYDEDVLDDEEIRRLKRLALEQQAKQERQAGPGLLRNNLDYEIAEKRAKYFGGRLQENGQKAAAMRPREYVSRRQAEQARPAGPDANQVAMDLEARRRKYEEEQRRNEELRRQRQAAQGGSTSPRAEPTSSRPAAASPPRGLPTTASEIEAYKRAMIERYEQQQRENAELLRRRREQQQQQQQQQQQAS